MQPQGCRALACIVASALAASLSCHSTAQVAPSQSKGNPDAPTPRWDIFAGYSVMDPLGAFHPLQPDGSAMPISFKLEKYGTVETASHYLSRNAGLQVDSGQHDLATNTGFASTGASNSGIFTLQGGPVYRWPGVHLTPFVHALGGGAYVDGPDHEPYTWGPVVTVGGGLDWFFGCHFGMRLFEADYSYFHINSGISHGTLATDNFVWGDDENINAVRLATGVVFRSPSAWSPLAGCSPAPPVALACVATPGVIFPGEPVTIVATPSGLNPKLNATYIWTGAGVTASDGTATVPTASLAPGTYTVRARVKEGDKAGQSADCEASFTVRRYEPPTLVCAAGPMVINPNQTSSVALTARSPQNRPLTFACTAESGSIAVNGNVATFTPAVGQSGPVAINCTAKDDLGQSAGCNTAVTVQQPPPPLSRVKPLCTLDFNKDERRPIRVDNEAKACLDDVGTNLQQDPEATLVVVGEATASEAPNTAAQRAVNTKQYLVTEKGIDPARITVVTGSESAPAVEQYLAPAGSHFSSDIPGTTPVDENVVKPVTRKPLPVRRHAKKPAPAKTPAKEHKKPAPPVPKPVDGP